VSENPFAKRTKALRKPTTTGTSERSERESYNHKKALY